MIEAAVVAGKAVLPSLCCFGMGKEKNNEFAGWLRGFERLFEGKGVAKKGRQKPVKPIKNRERGAPFSAKK